MVFTYDIWHYKLTWESQANRKDHGQGQPEKKILKNNLVNHMMILLLISHVELVN